MGSLPKPIVNSLFQLTRKKVIDSAKAELINQLNDILNNLNFELASLTGESTKNYKITGKLSSYDIKRKFVEGTADGKRFVSDVIGNDEFARATSCIQYLKSVDSSAYSSMLDASKSLLVIKQDSKKFNMMKARFMGVYHSLQSKFSTQWLGKSASSCGLTQLVNNNGKYVFSPDIIKAYATGNNKYLSDCAYVFMYMNGYKYSQYYNLSKSSLIEGNKAIGKSFGGVTFKVINNIVYGSYTVKEYDSIYGIEYKKREILISTPLSPSTSYPTDYYNYIAGKVKEVGNKYYKAYMDKINHLIDSYNLSMSINYSNSEDNIDTIESSGNIPSFDDFDWNSVDI